jgi:hypothetical protein
VFDSHAANSEIDATSLVILKRYWAFGTIEEDVVTQRCTDRLDNVKGDT